MTDRLPPVPTFVTGGAGFIGGEVVASLLRDGAPVTVFDNLSTAEPDWASRFDGDPGLSFVHGDITEYDVLREAMTGHDRVVHLASGTDIVGGYGHPERDFASGIVGTELVCEVDARRRHRRDLVRLVRGRLRPPRAHPDGRR